MKRGALTALAALTMALSGLNAQDTSSMKRVTPAPDTTKRTMAPAPAGTPLEQLVNEESQRRANIARVLLITNPQVANQQTALKNQSDQLMVDEQLVSSTRNQLTLAASAMKQQQRTSLVVLFAADSSGAAGVTSATLQIDGANTSRTQYSDTARIALRVGAADELYRGTVLATPHTIVLTTTMNGQAQQIVARVKAVPDATTYVQFAVQEGKLVQTAWASSGTNPF